MAVEPIISIRDRDWVRKSFFLSKDSITQSAQRWRTFTTASSKFTDTRLGGNYAINNPPAFTRYADPRVGGKVTTNAMREGDSVGMGRYYSEAIDDNSQIITMRFGVPEYNGMLTFFTGFYDSDASLLAREGRDGGIFYNAGKLLGLYLTLPYWRWIAAGFIFRWLAVGPASKYYYLKDAMGPYWNRVNFIANWMGVNMGLVPRIQVPGITGPEDQTRPDESADMIAYFHKQAPDVFKETGGIDVYRMANRTQRLANRYREQMQRILEGSTSSDELYDQMNKFLEERNLEDAGSESIEEYLARYYGSNRGNKAYSKGDASKQDLSQVGTEQTNQRLEDVAMRAKWVKASEKDANGNDVFEFFKGWFEPIKDDIEAGIQDGSQFISFRVDYTGSVNESFTNSARESDIQSKFNGASSSARSARFSFSEGNTGIGLIDSVTSSLKDLATGVIDGVQMSGLLALGGSAFADIPKHWDSSSATFPTSTFTMELRAPYGNRLSRYQNLIIPVACLLAAALPVSTGRQSYTSPFLCEMYNKGRSQIRLGLIDSLTITRGVGNLGWNNNGEPLAFDVSFSVMDLSSVMHAPIEPGVGIVPPWKGIFDDDNPFMDYMATLASLSMADQIYPGNKLALSLTRKRENFRSFFSRSHFANSFSNGFPGRVISAFARNADRSISL